LAARLAFKSRISPALGALALLLCVAPARSQEFSVKSRAVTSTVGGNINVARLAGFQVDATVAINAANPQQMVILGSSDQGALFRAYSTDAGATWISGFIADGTDGIYPAGAEPSAAFDKFGNLFVAYLNNN